MFKMNAYHGNVTFIDGIFCYLWKTIKNGNDTEYIYSFSK